MIFKKKSGFKENDLEGIIKACLIGDKLAEKSLIRMFLAFSKSIVKRYSSSNEDLEEIINDGFLKVFSNLSKYDFSKPFKAWFRTIIVHVAIDSYRKNHKYIFSDNLESLEIIDLNENILSSISADEIMSMIRCLPPVYRIVFTLYVIDGFNHREISDMLGIK